MRSGLIAALLGALLAGTGCTMPDPVRVMSFNIRNGRLDDGPLAWEARRTEVAGVIRAFAPDVCGLQEVIGTQVSDLQADLPDYAWLLDDDAHAREDGERCPLLYRKDRFFVTRTGFFWLSPEPERAHLPGWDAALPRMASWARLRFRSNPLAEFVVVNTHFDHVGKRAREESAKLIRLMTDGLAGEPIIVIGDFNAAPGSPPHVALTHDADNLAELRDTWRWLSLPEEAAGTFHGWKGGTDGRRIDWVLCNRRFRILEAGIDRTHNGARYPSDHYPVTAILELKPATDSGAL